MKRILLTIIILFNIVFTVQAQIDEPGGDVDVPVDGGLSLLVAAGAAYGARKMRRKIK